MNIELPLHFQLEIVRRTIFYRLENARAQPKETRDFDLVKSLEVVLREFEAMIDK